ncbi:MAG: SGNH/GDSL hydrolase family protein [Eubacterium sp.]|nr:SGNH/GDSL hydrolase family protein [Eubacterium sp.]
MKSILFYGDSNTWGYDPATGLRYPYRDRWTTVCADLLGSGYNCIPAGMNGRTTAFDDPVKGARNGIKGLDYELQTHKPLDLFVVMLGTNDLKYTDARGSGDGMDKLVRLVLSANERYNLSSPVFPSAGSSMPVLLISPILLKEHVGIRRDDVSESEKLYGFYKEIAEKYGIHFLDAALYAEPSGIDGIHLGAEGHKKLGDAIAGKIKRYFDELRETQD